MGVRQQEGLLRQQKSEAVSAPEDGGGRAPLPKQLDLEPQSFLPGPATSSQELGSEGQGSLSLRLPLLAQGERGFVCRGTQLRGGAGRLGRIGGREIPRTWPSPAWPPHPYLLLL